MSRDQVTLRRRIRVIGSFAALVGAAVLLVADSAPDPCSRGTDFGATYDVVTTCGGNRAATVTISATGATGECRDDKCWGGTSLVVLSGDAFLVDPRVWGSCSQGEPATVGALAVDVTDPVDTYTFYGCSISLATDLGKDVTCSSGPTGSSCSTRFTAAAAP